MYLILDIGGTNIRMAIFSHEGKIEMQEKFLTNRIHLKESFEQIKSIFLKWNIQVEKVAVGMPGPADYANGIMLNPLNLPGWWNLDVKKKLVEITKCDQIFFGNDAQLMAYANHEELKLSEKDITQFFTISTGLGAGLIINNKMFYGANNHAQEIAHFPINSLKEKNHLSQGALEYFVSGSGIAKRASIYGFEKSEEVFALYGQRIAAKKVIDDAIDGLANLIAASCALIGYNHLVFDGSVAMNNKWFVEKAFLKAKGRMFKNQYQNLTMHFSIFEDQAVLWGGYYFLKEEK